MRTMQLTSEGQPTCQRSSVTRYSFHSTTEEGSYFTVIIPMLEAVHYVSCSVLFHFPSALSLLARSRHLDRTRLRFFSLTSLVIAPRTASSYHTYGTPRIMR
jgi:hypothetical protein